MPRWRAACSGDRPPVARKTAQVIPEAADGFFRDHCTQHAAGIAYRVLFSIAPLTIALVALAGLVPRDPRTSAAVIDEIVELVPTPAGSHDTVESAVTSHRVAHQRASASSASSPSRGRPAG